MDIPIKWLLGALALTALLLAASYYVLFPQVETTIFTATSTVRGGSPSSSSTPMSSATSSASLKKEAQFTAPYSLSWKDSGVAFTLTGIAIDATTLTLRFKVTMPNYSTCVPLHLRRLIDESGDLMAPLALEFSFPGTGNCTGSAQMTYENQEVVFAVRPDNAPFTFTTGGTANIFFIVSLSETGVPSIELAPTSE